MNVPPKKEGINDQTTAYTEAEVLEKLTPGEKLSAALGKIAKAVTDLIAHLADKKNPHAVTAEQAGADKSGAAAAVQKNLDTHAADTENPHKVTFAQVGAAPAYTYGSTDLIAGTTALETGRMHHVYE